VGDMVPINYVLRSNPLGNSFMGRAGKTYVVPVSLTSLECSALKSECSLPRASLGGGLVVGKRKLARVVVP
jgi:hypothetical protein